MIDWRQRRWHALRGLASSILASTLGAIGDRAAHAAAESPDQTLEEVVVTAEIRKENLQRTPVSVSAVGVDAITQNDMTNLADVGMVVPNVTLQQGGAANGKSVLAFIRGVGTGDYSYTVEPGVAAYVDDVFLSGQFGDVFDLTDIERVEILRGPQGTLFGKNSIGGAIRLISRRPQGDGSGSVEVTLGDFHRREARGVLDVPLIRDALSLRVSAVTKQRDGYVNRVDFSCAHPDLGGIVNPDAPFIPTAVATSGNCKLGSTGGENVQRARAALRWHPSEGLDINVSADWMNDHSGPGAQSLIGVDTGASSPLNNPLGGFNAQVAIPIYGIPYDSRFVPGSIYQSYDNFHNIVHIGPSATFLPAAVTGMTSVPAKNAAKVYGVTASIESQLSSFVHLKSITAYRGYSGVFSQDVGDAPISVAAQTNLLDHHQFSQELQFLGELFNDKLQWTAGLFYLDSYSLNRGPVIISAFSWLVPELDFTQNDPSNIRDRAVFAQVTQHLTGELSFTIGARYTHEHKDYTFRHFSFDPTVPDLVPETPTQVNYGKTNGRVSLEYQWTPGLMSYVSAANAFRAGGFNGRPFNASQVVPFGPETLTSYEIGAKTEWFGRRLRINLDAFLERYEDLQVGGFAIDSTGTPFSTTVNQGRAQITGVEIELEMRPVRDFTLTAAFGLNQYTCRDLGAAINCNDVPNPIPVPAPGANCTIDGAHLGSPLPAVPARTASVSGEYRIRLPRGSTITPYLNASFESRTYFDAVGSPEASVPGRTLLNGRIAWQSKDSLWQAALSVSNLTNKQYFVFKQDLRPVYGMLTGQPGRPREWVVTLKWAVH